MLYPVNYLLFEENRYLHGICFCGFCCCWWLPLVVVRKKNTVAASSLVIQIQTQWRYHLLTFVFCIYKITRPSKNCCQVRCMGRYHHILQLYWDLCYSLYRPIKFPVLIGLGPVFFQSFSSLFPVLRLDFQTLVLRWISLILLIILHSFTCITQTNKQTSLVLNCA